MFQRIFDKHTGMHTISLRLFEIRGHEQRATSVGGIWNHNINTVVGESADVFVLVFEQNLTNTYEPASAKYRMCKMKQKMPIGHMHKHRCHI